MDNSLTNVLADKDDNNDKNSSQKLCPLTPPYIECSEKKLYTCILVNPLKDGCERVTSRQDMIGV